jgi:hypothetical protein
MGTTVHCLLAEDCGFPATESEEGGGAAARGGGAGPASGPAAAVGKLAQTFSAEFKYNRSSPVIIIINVQPP